MSKIKHGPFVPERLKLWEYWITEREAIRKKKDAGAAPPWTRDHAMATTRWCNVRRMDDKVSKWLVDNWYVEDMVPRDAVIAGLLGRMLNRPETLLHLNDGKPYSGWKYELFRKRLGELRDAGETIFTRAYIISGMGGGPKYEVVLAAIDKAAKSIGRDVRAATFVDPDSMESTAHKLMGVPGVGSFLAGQVVADLRWVIHTDRWLDRMTWAPRGPGSSRGMRYLLGQPLECVHGRGNDLRQPEFIKYLRPLIEIAQLHPKVGPIFEERRLEAHDIQNTLCELSKLARIRDGGRGKNPYIAVAP